MSYTEWKIGKVVEEVEDLIEKEGTIVKKELEREHHVHLEHEAQKEAEKEIKEKYKLKAMENMDREARARLQREAEVEVRAEATKRLAEKERSERGSEDTYAMESWAAAIIKVSCILVIGVVILNSVVSSINVSSGSEMAPVFTTMQDNIASGYTLAALMVLALGAGAIMHFLGFM